MTRFAFIDREKACYDITVLCSLLKVSRSGFYAWQRRAPSASAVADEVVRYSNDLALLAEELKA